MSETRELCVIGLSFIVNKLELLGDSAPLTTKERKICNNKLKQGLFYDDIVRIIHERRYRAWI